MLTATSIPNAPQFASSITFKVRKDLPAVQRIAHEIQRPHGVHPGFNGQRLTLALRHASPRASRQV
jgi:hypothetical protein